jgi:putative ATP-dependent endonuclease of the OLD family
MRTLSPWCPRLLDLITDPVRDKTGMRLRTLQERLGTADKDFATLKAAAGEGLKAVILEAALGKVPAGKEKERHHYKSQAQTWFKTREGGRELADKVFGLGLWPRLKPRLLPFCVAVREAVGLPTITDVPP